MVLCLCVFSRTYTCVCALMCPGNAQQLGFILTPGPETQKPDRREEVNSKKGKSEEGSPSKRDKGGVAFEAQEEERFEEEGAALLAFTFPVGWQR